MIVDVTDELCCLYFSVLCPSYNSKWNFIYCFTCIVIIDLPMMPISTFVWSQATDLDCDSLICYNKQISLQLQFVTKTQATYTYKP